MDYSRGFYFCTHPHPDPSQHYDCGHLVDFKKYTIEIRSTADCIPANVDANWDRVITEKLEIVEMDDSELIAKYAAQLSISKAKAKEILARRVHYPVLKDKVVDWLNTNVAPSTDINRANFPNGWVTYSKDALIQGPSSSFTLFFLRRRDALKFIKVWSVTGKPTSMFSQL